MRAISIGANLDASTTVVIYTVPKGYYAKFNFLHILNSAVSTKHISVSWTDTSAGITIPLLIENSVSSKTYLEILGDSFLVLEEYDYISITTDSGSMFSVTATVEQIKKEGI